MSFPARGVFPDSTAVTAAGHLQIGGADVTELAAEYGTPLYIFDEASLRNTCQEYLQEFQSRHAPTAVTYASKAFLNLALAHIFAEEGMGLDVVSGGELAMALKGGMPPERVYFHGNNKSPDELAFAVDQGCGVIVVDNFYEMENLNQIAGARGKKQNILLRISPSVDPHTHHHTTTGTLDSKFGFPLETGQASEAVRLALASENLTLQGLHFHLGSPIFETEPYAEGIRRALQFAADHRASGLDLQELNVGGGFAIRHTRNDEPPTIARYADVIVSTVNSECARLGLAVPRLVVEPGRSVVGPAGVAVYSVGATKDIPGIRKYVSVDGGMGDNIRPALYDAQYEAVVANRMNDLPTETITLAGKFCESGDVLVRDFPLPALHAGDLIAIPASGGYAPSMASNYNLAPRPAIILVKEGEARLIRRRESYEDMMSLDVA
ncbi:MAG: diaminopimelate decarboxylase [Chloroflexi bacterium]|nr:MAG: diaminopimelate decarboxylase [Chloroflexota bacterium]